MNMEYQELLDEFNSIVSGSPFNISLKIVNDEISFLYNRLNGLGAEIWEYIITFYYNNSFFETLTLRSRDVNELLQTTQYIIEIENSKQKIDAFIKYRCLIDFDIIKKITNDYTLDYDKFLYLYFRQPSMYKPIIEQLLTSEECEKIKTIKNNINENQRLLEQIGRNVQVDLSFYFNGMIQEPKYMNL